MDIAYESNVTLIWNVQDIDCAVRWTAEDGEILQMLHALGPLHAFGIARRLEQVSRNVPQPGVAVRGAKGVLKMKAPALFTLLVSLLAGLSANAQTPTPAKHRICMDVAHQQRFWNDPADMAGKDPKQIERVKYMTEN